MEKLLPFYHQALSSIRDLAPVVLVVLFFQVIVLRQPLPDAVQPLQLFVGLVCVILGLTLFLKGLEWGLFPVGENLANEFTRKASLFWLLGFAFALGFGSTVAEPALIAVARQAARVVSEAGLIAVHEASQGEQFAFVLRLVVALSVGTAVLVGVLRIVKGWSLPMMIIGGYVIALLLTLIAPQEIVGIAYDSGGVTTSTITVPLVTALGIGLASSIKGRSPVLDGFGLIAFASIMPIIFVLLFGTFGLVFFQ